MQANWQSQELRETIEKTWEHKHCKDIGWMRLTNKCCNGFSSMESSCSNTNDTSDGKEWTNNNTKVSCECTHEDAIDNSWNLSSNTLVNWGHEKMVMKDIQTTIPTVKGSIHRFGSILSWLFFFLSYTLKHSQKRNKKIISGFGGETILQKRQKRFWWWNNESVITSTRKSVHTKRDLKHNRLRFTVLLDDDEQSQTKQAFPPIKGRVLKV